MRNFVGFVSLLAVGIILAVIITAVFFIALYFVLLWYGPVWAVIFFGAFVGSLIGIHKSLQDRSFAKTISTT